MTVHYFPGRTRTCRNGFRRSHIRRASTDVAAICGALLLVVVAGAVGYFLLSRGVPLNLQAPPLFARLIPHVGIGSPSAVVVGLLGIRFGPRLAIRLPWRRLIPLAAVTGVAWTSSLALVDGWQQGWAGRLATPDEYLHDVPRVGALRPFLSGFTRHILDFQPGSWTTHVSSHPPGATLVFVLLDRIGIGGGAWAGAVVILVGSSAGIAVCLTLDALGAPMVARRLVPFAVLFPGAVWVGVSADGLFAGVAAWGVALAVLGCRRGGAAGQVVAGAGGLLLGCTAYLSYGLVLLVAVVAAAVVLTGRRGPWLAAAAGASAVVTWFTGSGFDWFQAEHLVTLRYYQGIASQRPYAYYVWANFAALTLSVGPVVAAGLIRAGNVVRNVVRNVIVRRRWERETLVPALLSLAAGLSVLVADLSGLSKAETERIWLPFGVWLIASLALLPRRFVPVALTTQVAVALLVNHLVVTYW